MTNRPDANWNVVAVTDETGTVQERYVYDAFGNVNGLNSDWNRTFTGQVYDNETGLMLYRNRFYSPGLGRFLQRDPIGYGDDTVSLYRYVRNGVVDKTDILGLRCCPEDNPASSYACCSDFKRSYESWGFASAHDCALSIGGGTWIAHPHGGWVLAGMGAAGTGATTGIWGGPVGAGVGIVVSALPPSANYAYAKSICNSYTCDAPVGNATCSCTDGYIADSWTCRCPYGSDIYTPSSSGRYTFNPGGGGNVEEDWDIFH